MAMSMEVILQVYISMPTQEPDKISNAKVLCLIIRFSASGIDSAEILIDCAQNQMCKYHVQGKYD